MFSLARLRPALALAAVLLGPACSVVNTDHCGNREGNATCQQRDPSTPYCSICVADNNGCLAEDPGGSCLAETAPPIIGDASSSTSSPTTSDPVSSSTSDEPPTSTTRSTTTTGDPTTTTSPLTTTTTGETTTTSTGETTTSTGPDTSTSTGDTDTSTGSDTGETGSSSGSTDTSDTGGPFCGNNVVEGDEVCDGTDLNDKKCATLLPDKWGGGTLKCNNCSSYNDTDCCIGVGQKCKPLVPSEACCGGLTCKPDMLLVNRCQN